MKKCNTCNEEKELNDFGINRIYKGKKYIFILDVNNVLKTYMKII